MKGDQKIKTKVAELKGLVDELNDWLTNVNPCAYTDSIIEKIIEKVKAVKTLYVQSVKPRKCEHSISGLCESGCAQECDGFDTYCDGYELKQNKTKKTK